MAAWNFDAPAGMKDFSDPGVWHDNMAEEARVIVLLLVASALGKDPRSVTEDVVKTVSPELAYVDPVVNEPPADAETIPIQGWQGFPRAVLRRAPWSDFPMSSIRFATKSAGHPRRFWNRH